MRSKTLLFPVLTFLTVAKCNTIYSAVRPMPYSNRAYTNNSIAKPSNHHQNIVVQPRPVTYSKPTTTSTTTVRPAAKYEVTNLDSAYSSAGPTVYSGGGGAANSSYKCEYNEPPKLPEMSDAERDHSIVARIHRAGFQGYVLFSPSSSSSYLNQESVSVSSLITHSRTHGLPIKEAFSWRIYNQHSIDSNGACALFLNSDDLLHDLTINFGPIITGKPQTFSSEELQSAPLGKQAKQGLASLLGKTLMLIGAESNIKICATLLPAGGKQVYEAKLHSPIAGRFKLVQATGAGLQLAVLTEYLMYSNGERKESKHRWQIVDAAGPPLDHKYNHEKIFSERFYNERTSCADLKGKFVLSSNEIVSNK